MRKLKFREINGLATVSQMGRFRDEIQPRVCLIPTLRSLNSNPRQNRGLCRRYVTTKICHRGDCLNAWLILAFLIKKKNSEISKIIQEFALRNS